MTCLARLRACGYRGRRAGPRGDGRALFVLASAAQGSSNPLVDYGLFGVLFVALVTLWLSGRVVSGREYDRVLQINDRLSTDNAALRERLIESADKREESTSALRETAAVLRDVLVVLEVKRRSP